MSILSKVENRRFIHLLPPSPTIQGIIQQPNKPAQLLCGNKWMNAACLKCADQWCIKYAEQELSCDLFPDFSFERNDKVCPMNAITWDYSIEYPVINEETCIGCGLCVARCPIGALYLENGTAKVEKCISQDYSIHEPKFVEFHRSQIKALRKLRTNKRIYQIENHNNLAEIYRRISLYDGRSQIHNLLIRNLMLALGYHCAISRAGDVYTRIDAVFEATSEEHRVLGAMEIEFGRDTLEAARSILDDIAVLESRNHIHHTRNTPLVVCLSFPNKRQGYFQVVKDIHNVVGIKVQTVSVGALLILLWNHSTLNLESDMFYTDFDNMSIRKSIEHHIDRSVDLPEGDLGVVEPEK